MFIDSQIRLCKKKCQIKTPFGTIPCPWLHAPEISNTRPELNNITIAVTIEKFEELKTSGQATKDDYPLLGYFYSLDKKYDQSEANYLRALELATDDATKAIIEQELKKVRAATREPQLGGETKQ